jgi:amidase
MVPFAHGNDIGGSIRYPAYACGIVGIRPTVGRVPSWFGPTNADESMSVQTMVAQGPLARSVDDLRLVLDAMSGFDTRDRSSVPVPPVNANPRMLRLIRVGVLTDVGVVRPESAVMDALNTAATWLADAGYGVERIELPLLAEAWRLWWLLAMEDFRQIMPMVEKLGEDGIRRAATHYYEVSKAWWGVQPGLVDYMNGHARRGTLIARLQQFLERCPLVLLPISAEGHGLTITSVTEPPRSMPRSACSTAPSSASVCPATAAESSSASSQRSRSRPRPSSSCI